MLDISLEITNLRLQPHYPGANKLRYVSFIQSSGAYSSWAAGQPTEDHPCALLDVASDLDWIAKDCAFKAAIFCDLGQFAPCDLNTKCVCFFVAKFTLSQQDIILTDQNSSIVYYD